CIVIGSLTDLILGQQLLEAIFFRIGPHDLYALLKELRFDLSQCPAKRFGVYLIQWLSGADSHAFMKETFQNNTTDPRTYFNFFRPFCQCNSFSADRYRGWLHTQRTDR